MPKISADRPAGIGCGAVGGSGQLARQQGVKQARARRPFKAGIASAAGGVTVLVPIRAATQDRSTMDRLDRP